MTARQLALFDPGASDAGSASVRRWVRRDGKEIAIWLRRRGEEVSVGIRSGPAYAFVPLDDVPRLIAALDQAIGMAEELGA